MINQQPAKPAFYYQGFSNPNGTIVPDDVFDVLAPELTEAELRVLLYIVRRTFGFKKQSDAISVRQLTRGIRTREGRVLDRGTGMSSSAVWRGVKGLVEKGIIVAQRARSAERGDEPTTYTLRFSDAVARPEVAATDPVLSSRERETPPFSAGENGGTLAESTQQTVVQQTEGYLSNLRMVPPEKERPATRRPVPVEPPPANRRPTTVAVADARGTPRRESPGHPGPAGVEAIGAVLRRRYGHPAPAAREARQVIEAFMRDFAAEFNDRAPLASSTSRAVNLMATAGIRDLATFTSLLHEARAVTKDRVGSPRSPLGGRPGGGAPPRRAMAYFFAVLTDRLGLAAPGA